MLLVTSLFEGLGDDAVTSIGEFAGVVPTAVVLYDLIPLIHSKIYLENPVIRHWYLNKLGSTSQESIFFYRFRRPLVVRA